VLADPKFGLPGRIDLLLGAEVHSQLIRVGNIDLGTDKPTLQETALGWIVFGAVRQRLPAAIARNITTKPRADPVPALEKFWKLDTFNTEVPAMTVFDSFRDIHVHSYDTLKFVGGLWAWQLFLVQSIGVDENSIAFYSF